MGDDDLADIEGDADLLLRLYKIDDTEPLDVLRLCRRMTGHAPFMTRTGPEAKLSTEPNGTRRVCVRFGTYPPRATWLACHELAELHYDRIGYRGDDVERRCDALGAALACPRRALLAATKRYQHRVHLLAKALGTTQSLALLRIGEVDRRPVLLSRTAGLIVRGASFVWPANDELDRALKGRVRGVHPLMIRDEPARAGLMAAA